MDVKLMKAANLTPKDMVMHMALTQEYIWMELTPGEDKKVREGGREGGGHPLAALLNVSLSPISLLTQTHTLIHFRTQIVTLMDAKGLSLMRLGSSDCLALIRAASEVRISQLREEERGRGKK